MFFSDLIRFTYTPSMDLKVRHLRLVQAIHGERTLTGAARRLRLSQAAVSQGLRELETVCGQSLFERTRGGWLPTLGGKRLLAAAEQVLATLAHARSDLELLAEGRGGVLRLATECYTGYHWLPPVLARLRRSFPDYDVHLVAEATRDPVRWLRRGELDVALTHLPHDDDPDLRVVPLFRDELVAVLPPDHRLASLPHLDAEHFAGEELILHFDAPSSVVVRELLEPAAVAPKRITELQLTEAVLAAVRAGMGVSVLARWAVAPEIDSGRLVARPLTARGFHRQWSATTLRATEHTKVVEALIAAIREGTSSLTSPRELLAERSK